MKFDFAKDIGTSLKALKEAGGVPKWGVAANSTLVRRNVFMGELRQIGIKAPDQIAVASIRNDAAFFTAVTAVSSVAAVALSRLPGDWGFFTSYLAGSVVLVVLAIGSTAPGLLQFAIDYFSQVFPDYRERVVAHEAAHFLVGYLLGVPITNYSLLIGREHTEFAEAKLQQRIIERQLEDSEIDSLAAVAVAGVAGEGLKYEQVMGQSADLMDLQRLLLRSKTKISAQQQQSVTRWAVWEAARLLKQYKPEYEALQAALQAGKSVPECIAVIEGTPSA